MTIIAGLNAPSGVCLPFSLSQKHSCGHKTHVENDLIHMKKLIESQQRSHLQPLTDLCWVFIFDIFILSYEAGMVITSAAIKNQIIKK